VELDISKATWLSNDIVMFSSKNGEILLLTVVYDGRYDTSSFVQQLDFVGITELSLFCFSVFSELCKDWIL
jgi:hypothetical protein